MIGLLIYLPTNISIIAIHVYYIRDKSKVYYYFSRKVSRVNDSSV